MRRLIVSTGLLSCLFVVGCQGADSAGDEPAGSTTKADVSGGYACRAPANPDRGFSLAFEVRVSAGQPATMSLIADGQSQVLGEVEVMVLESGNPGTRPAFEMTLGLFAEADVSGLTDISAVSTIVQYRIGGDSERGLYRFLKGKQQIGGSFLADGMATRCLPAAEPAGSEVKQEFEAAWAKSESNLDGFAVRIERKALPEEALAAWDAAWTRLQAKVSDVSPIGYQLSLDTSETLYLIVIWDPDTMGAHLEILTARETIARGDIADDGGLTWK